MCRQVMPDQADLSEASGRGASTESQAEMCVSPGVCLLPCPVSCGNRTEDWLVCRGDAYGDGRLRHGGQRGLGVVVGNALGGSPGIHRESHGENHLGDSGQSDLENRGELT